ncbi:MAG: PKD domain-containing protein, partial [Planctomycetota bacterium]
TLEPIGVGEQLTLTGLFTELGVQDDVTVEVDWGDSTTTGGQVSYTSPVGGEVRASHTYQQAGDYSVTVRLLDDDGGVSNSLTTVVRVIQRQPVQISQILIDDGSGQRSVVRSITVDFTSLVIADAGAFLVTTNDGATVPVNVELLEVDGKSRAVLTFSGDSTDSSGSLEDGFYNLQIVASLIRDTNGNQLDGDNDGSAGGDLVDEFFRFFGDADGDRDVDNLDLFAFRAAYRTTSNDDAFDAAFDSNDDGVIDNIDLFAFRRNYRRTI